MPARIIAIAGRALLALLFILAGLAKIAAPQGALDQMAAHHLPGILLPLVILLELSAGAALLRRQLRRVLDDTRHRAHGLVALRQVAGLEEVGNVLHAPFGEVAFLRDVRHPTLAFGIRRAGKALRGDNAAEEIARAVALRAMTQSVDEIGAAIPCGGMRRVRDERLAVKKQQLPDSNRAANVE